MSGTALLIVTLTFSPLWHLRMARAARALAEGDLQDAGRIYAGCADVPDRGEARFGLGLVAAAAGRFDEAAALFEEADMPASDYNAGTSLLLKALGAAGGADEAAAQAAAERLKRVLLRNPDDADARANLELALRLLARSSGRPEEERQGGDRPREEKESDEPGPQDRVGQGEESGREQAPAPQGEHPSPRDAEPGSRREGEAALEAARQAEEDALREAMKRMAPALRGASPPASVERDW